MAKVALKLMLELIVGSRAVDWQIAPWNGTGLEPPYARTCIPTLKPSTVSILETQYIYTIASYLLMIDQK
jgi:hypothetical protein